MCSVGKKDTTSNTVMKRCDNMGSLIRMGLHDRLNNTDITWYPSAHDPCYYIRARDDPPNCQTTTSRFGNTGFMIYKDFTYEGCLDKNQP